MRGSSLGRPRRNGRRELADDPLEVADEALENLHPSGGGGVATVADVIAAVCRRCCCCCCC